MKDHLFTHDVFLSHNQAQKDWTRELARRLRDDGFRVWFDEWELPRFGGASWPERLQEGVKASRKVALVWSPEFFDHQWPQFEATVIQFIDPVGRQQRIVPLLQSPCHVPEGWGFRQFLDFTGCLPGSVEFEFRYQQLLHNLDNSRAFEGDFERFKKAYIADVPFDVEAQTINAAVADLRRITFDDIQSRCGTIRVLTMVYPIELASIYTDVNVLQNRTASSRKTLNEMFEAAREQMFGRLSGEEGLERIPAFNAVTKHQRLLIYGQPGAGKTTFAKRLAYRCGTGHFKPDHVPFFATLKDFADLPHRPTLHEYIRGLWGNHAGVNTAVLAGRVLVLLDGLDEVSDRSFDRVRTEIEHFATEFFRCPMILTCRIAARESVFPQFADVEIAEFNSGQIEQFSHKWFGLRGDEIKAEQFCLRLADNSHVSELASNPLLLTLLCLVFEDRNDFEGTRAELYQEGFDILLRKWDAMRNIERDRPYRSLTVADKESLLADIAYSHFLKGEYFFERSELEQEIKLIFQMRNLVEPGEELVPEAVLNAIESQHGLLVQRAMGIYSFSHLTFQEYLTAKRIAKNPALLTQE